jgi:hypothetical protein
VLPLCRGAQLAFVLFETDNAVIPRSTSFSLKLVPGGHMIAFSIEVKTYKAWAGVELLTSISVLILGVGILLCV